MQREGKEREPRVKESYGFQHLDHSVTVSRVELIREAIISVADMELGAFCTRGEERALWEFVYPEQNGT